ncbi:UNVERIFIED_CONTAM: hypothetical protein GTU68_063734 [Idotea baltica]|nr:hypothetical protein [Idotea baltica]
MLDKGAPIFVAGHQGMVGQAVVRRLSQSGYQSLITQNREQLDLTDALQVRHFFQQQPISAMVIAAAKVGGIEANRSAPVDFLQQNLLLQTNLIAAAHEHGIQKLIFLGSSCIYPRLADQPISESALLQGYLEPTNDAYAIAKIAGIKLCEAYNRQYKTDFRSLMPTNLYGPGDNFSLTQAHVAPALMRRLHEAKQANAPAVTVWGTGNPRREFLHVDDLATAIEFMLNLSTQDYQNVGTGVDISISELAKLLADIVGYSGKLQFDTSKPDGTPRKLLDVTKLKNLGWQAVTTLEDGLRDTYSWYCDNAHALRL